MLPTPLRRAGDAGRALLLAIGLTACAAPIAPQRRAASADAVTAILARAQVIGATLRAGAACGRPVGVLAQDHAARLETAAIALQEARSGIAGRDAFLASMRPPEAPTARARIAWCVRSRPDADGIERFLTAADGVALIATAEELVR